MKSRARSRSVQRTMPRAKRRKVRPKRTAQPQQQSQPVEQPYIRNNEEDLICKILERSDAKKIPELATLFSYMMSNLTPSLIEVTRMEGVRAGRSLYNISSQRRRYMFDEESVADLVKFFEHAGYNRIMYNVFPDKTVIRLYDMPKENIGIKVHAFEAGLISGFLGAARKHFVEVEERTCFSDGSPMCSFETVGARTAQPSTDTKRMLRLFCEHV